MMAVNDRLSALRILVIGGYGGFGARLCRRLAAAGHHIMVGGRSIERARLFCRELPGAEPVAIDRTRDVAPILSRHRPDLVIDAAGPFQDGGFAVPEACIRYAIPYLDLADATDFVTGIGRFDEAARRAGVAIVSGASSAPALTAAVARRLAEGLDRVHSVDIALSAANRASGGDSVIAAVLSYVGRHVPLWRGGRWTQGFGWQEMLREDFIFADGSGLRGRLVALADLPDCTLLPELLPGRPAVTFRAGTESAFQMVALWLASWAVRWGWLRSLAGAKRWLLPFHRLTSRSGGKRSAMSITLAGSRAGECVERRWTIVAEEGDGLEIPTLSAELLAADLLAGRLPAGAGTAAGLLSLDRYEPAFASLAVRHETGERELPLPLYERLLGERFHRLPEAVRTMHEVCRDAGAAGGAEVVRGKNLAARMIARLIGFPPTGRWPLHVTFRERDGVETWTRDFGGHRFTSRLAEAGSLICESFGPLRFLFTLEAGESGLAMHLRGWSFLRLPLPRALAPRIAAREWQEQGRFRFDVRVALPVAGPVIGYAGWLSPLGERAEDRAARAPLSAASAS
jgi:hypothetical protein